MLSLHALMPFQRIDQRKRFLSSAPYLGPSGRTRWSEVPLLLVEKGTSEFELERASMFGEDSGSEADEPGAEPAAAEVA